MSTIKGGIAAYNDCADVCEAILKRKFPAEKLPSLSADAIWAAEFAAREVVKQLAETFRLKADRLEELSRNSGRNT